MIAESPNKVEAMHIEMELSIAAPREKVFAALVGDISTWWGAPYLTTSNPSSLVIEPTVGGRFYEAWGDGEGALWGVVTSIKRDQWLEYSGTVGMSGAVHAVVRFQLTDRDGGTLLTFSHRAMGELTQETAAGYAGGWKDLLETRLRAWLERGERLGLGHEPA